MLSMTVDELNRVLRLDGPPCRFGSPGELRVELTDLVVRGVKTATAGLVAEFEVEGEPVPVAGMRSAVIDDDEQVIGVMVTTRQETLRLADVFWEFARDEGEGFTDVDDWRTQHEGFWNRHSVPMLRELHDPGFRLTDDTPVSCEWFTFEPLAMSIPWPGPPDPADR